MARKCKDNTVTARKTKTVDLEPDTFEEFLYKTRLQWTKHVIPICYKDPDTGAYLEGYITGSVTADKSSSDDDDDEIEKEEDDTFSLKSPLNIRSAYFGTLFCHYLKIDIKDIYPSNRKLTIIEGRELKDYKFGNLYPNYVNKYRTMVKTDTGVVIATLEKYKGIHFTLPEIACMVNDKPENIKSFIDTYLDASYSRVCKITGEEQVTYKMKDIRIIPHTVKSSIDEITSDYSDCQRCELGRVRVSRGCPIVPGRGNKTNPKIFFLGEAPGELEERDVIPFHPDAPAGGVLDKVLKKVGLTEKDYFIDNSVWCRPMPKEGAKSQNGTPTFEHIKTCNSRLKNQLLLLNPKIVVLLGKSAYMAYFGREPEGVLKSVGWIETEGPKVYFITHPSYIVRQLSNTSDQNSIKLEYLKHFENIKNMISSL